MSATTGPLSALEIHRAIALACAVLLAGAADGSAQQRKPPRFPLDAAHGAGSIRWSATRFAQPLIVAPLQGVGYDGIDMARRPTQTDTSRFIERALSGLIVGSVAGLVSLQAAPDATDLAIPAYIAGTTVGVAFAAARKEGVRPLSLLVGTVVGAVPLACAWRLDRAGHPGAYFCGVLGYFTTPLGAAIGQGHKR